MKFIPKRLLRSVSKKTRSLSRSDPPSFSSGISASSSSSSSSDSHLKEGVGGPGTPTSVLPSLTQLGASGDFSDLPTDSTLELFKVVDKDEDGKITKNDLESLLVRLGLAPETDEELSMMLTEIDRDGDGVISLEEFGAISSAFGPACGSELLDAFNFFDVDRDGKITAEELLRGFLAIGDDRCTLEDCRRMIDGADSNGDGFVCFDDFSRMMEQQRC